MKKTILILFVFNFSFSYAQSWQWVKQGICVATNNNFAAVSGVAVDNGGNVFETGDGQLPIIFGTDTLKGSHEYAMLIKCDSNGNVLWAKNSTNIDSSTTYAYSVAIDGVGNSYITGGYQGTTSFDSVFLHGHMAEGYAFLASYTPNGKLRWALCDSAFTIYSFARSQCVCTDKFSNVYITGWYNDTIAFAGNKIPTSGYTNTNLFIAKFDSSGNLLWVRSSSIPNYTDVCFGYGVATDDSGNAYVSGSFGDTATIGTVQLINKGLGMFVAKYNPSGNVEWIQTVKGPESGANDNGKNAIAVDKSYNSYLTGTIQDTDVFGPDTIRSMGSSIFISKLSPTGQFLWTKANSETSRYNTFYFYTGSIAVNSEKHIFTCGTFDDTLNFSGIFLTSNSVGPAYILGLDSMGNGIEGTYINVLNDDPYFAPTAVTFDPFSCGLYFGGAYESSQCIVGTDTLNAISSEGNSFLAKWQPCSITSNAPSVTAQPPLFSLYPNPSNGIFTVGISNNEQEILNIEVFNMFGQRVYSKLSIANCSLSINLSGKPNGIYLYRVLKETGELVGEGKVVIEH
jgi:hypothetical protein